MTSTARVKRPSRDRWLYRLDGSDYGPVSTDDLLAAILERKVDLSTSICKVARGAQWTAAAEHAILRDHYAQCAQRWAEEELAADADRQVRKMARRETAKSGVWRIGLVGFIVAVGLGSWLVWRLTQAQEIGLRKLTRHHEVAALPKPTLLASSGALLPRVHGTRVAVLREFETYDTSGVRIGAPAGPAPATKMAFAADGSVVGGGGPGIDPAALKRVLADAQRRLGNCATSAAKRDRSFRGTDVSFSVTPGRIAGVGVGNEARRKPAFIACVKAALRRVDVPNFSGRPRRATIPLKVAW